MHGSLVTRVTTICVGVDRGSYVLGAASHGSRTDGSASGRGAPGTLPAVSPAEMGVWAEPRAGGAAPTPI